MEGEYGILRMVEGELFEGPRKSITEKEVKSAIGQMNCGKAGRQTLIGDTV